MIDMKRITFLLLMMITSVISFADNVFYGDDVNVAPGETATVTVYFDNTDEGINTIDFFMNLPEWLEYVDGSFQFVESRTNDEDPDDMDVQLIWRDASKDLKFTYEQSSYKKYSVVGSGKFFTFEVKASASVENGTTGQITFNLDEAEMYKGKLLDDVEFSCTPINVTVGAAAETVSITLDHDVITYCSDKTLDFSDVAGLTASYVSAVTSTEAELTGVGAVASGQGIILQGEEGTTYEVPVVEEGEDLAGNILIGVLEATSIDAGNYILMDGVFIPCIDGTLPAGKAYLPKDAVTSGAKVISLVFGESTGINEVQKSEADGAIYNLSGMRVSKTQKGVYIMNGRKVIVK